MVDIDEKLGTFKLVEEIPYSQGTIDRQLPSYGVYLVVIENQYGAGAIWLVQSGTARDYPKCDFIAGENTYFNITGVGNKFIIRITQNGATANAIRIYAI